MQQGVALPAKELVRGVLWQSGEGHILGTYRHGMFENTAVLWALFGAEVRGLDDAFTRNADGVSEWFR